MSIDKALLKKTRGRWKRCSKGHLNSPNAKECWKCGEKFPIEPTRLTRYV